MKNIYLRLKNVAVDESGQDLIEYALIASLIALVAVTAMSTLATDISTAFTNIGAKINPTT